MSVRNDATARPYADEAFAINARNVEFDWSGVPIQHLPGEAYASHFINVMHLVLPEGERAMANAFAEALPLIDDERLREEVVGFVGQEATHARSHEGFRTHMAAQGLDVTPIVNMMEFLVDGILGDHGLTGRARHAWLCERLGFFAAAEHFTAVVGEWLLDAEHFDRMGMDPTMLDLLRWHGAEEMEHRNVAFDAYQYVDGSYARRVRTALVASSTLAVLWFATSSYLYKHDPAIAKRRPWPWEYASATVRGIIPSFSVLVIEMPRYLHPKFHPSQLGSLDKAIRYLAQSPAARAAAG
jgi:uncharacterized protein